MWAALAETHKFSRALGGGPVAYEPVSGAGAVRYAMSTRSAGFQILIDERPFDWRQPESLVITRRVRNAPFTFYRLRLELAEEQSGCRVVVTLEVTPSSALMWPFVRVQAARTINRMARLIASIDHNLQTGMSAYAESDRRVTAVGVIRERVAALEGAIAEEDRPIAKRLVDELTGAPDLELQRLRPYELAVRWKTDRRRTLAVCLRAVQVGLLELRWEVICPSCRIAAETAQILGALGDRVHCQLCDLTSTIDFDRSVEVVLRPDRAVRAVPDGPYCIGGPFRTPHVIEQSILAAGGTAILRAPDEPCRLRLFVRGGATASVEVVNGAARTTEIAAGERIDPAQIVIAPGGELHVIDRLGDERHVKLERLDWASLAATGFHVSVLPEFRRLFSSQVLRPDVLLQIGRAAFLFSDLSGSTAYYARVGDAIAYALVKDHFDAAVRAVEAHGGAVVKTMGDSVMAAFPDEADAIRTAAALMRAHDELALSDPDAPRLKIGVYAGACYAVTANGTLDYFGQTVNLAQRLASVARPGEIVVPASLVPIATAAELRVSDESDATLKGIDDPVRIARVQ
jgi:class 3 adenylate cyclase